MKSGKSPIRAALLLAVPIEIVNFLLTFRIYPPDVGFAPDARWYTKAVGFQGLSLHWPGLWLGQWVYNTRFEWLVPFLWAVSGYIDTVVVIIAGIFIFRLVRHASRCEGAVKTTL